MAREADTAREAYRQILFEIDTDSGIATVTLHRPQAKNAFSHRMTLELDDALRRARDDPAVRVVLLRGSGDCFSSGHDLGTPEHLADLEAAPYVGGVRGDYRKWSELDVEMCLAWRQLSKPVVCAVHGYCIYHACAVVSCCDIVIAAEDARFMPSLVEATFLPWDTHPRRAKEIMLMQRFVQAQEAAELGLVSRVVPRAELEREALATAKHLASGDSFHMEMMKAVCNSAQDAGLSAGVRGGLAHWAAYRSGADDPTSTATPGRPGTAAASGAWEGKKFAPVKSAQSGTAWQWTLAKNRSAAERSRL